VSKSKAEESFGLDPALVSKIAWSLALKRVIHDLRSDFIWAPHIRFIYHRAGDALVGQIKADLSNGTFHTGVPLTIEVPKSFRIKVGGKSKRLGPSFSRPGSVLPPRDRILYQAMADEAASIVEKKTDKSRSFSHRLAEDGSSAMFLSTRKCWSELQKALKAHIANPKFKYILKVDVADYFGSINQHTLINTLKDSGYNGSLAAKLESLLISYTGQRSSRGILQGVYPSDLFGAFYMNAVDRLFDDAGMASARYVDDIYVFAESVDACDRVLRWLIPQLRTFDLALNEVKSTILTKDALFTEEPDLETLFTDAIAEISQQIDDDDDVEVDYGFQKDWEDDEEDEGNDEGEEVDLELEATKLDGSNYRIWGDVLTD
jgi:hypothetical protein